MLEICPACEKNHLITRRAKMLEMCFTCEEEAEQEFQISVDKFKEAEEHHSIKRIIFPSKIYARMNNYCQLAKGEISGLGEIEETEDSVIVKKIVLLKQECSGASTKISADSLNHFTYQMARKGLSLENYKLWWHTHYNFDVYWSHIDEENIKSLLRFMQGRLYSVVINQMGDVLGRIDERRSTYKLSVVNRNFKRYKNLYKKCRRQVGRLVSDEKPIAYQTKGQLWTFYE